MHHFAVRLFVCVWGSAQLSFDMGRKLETLLGKKFKSSKCKTLLKLTISRTKILKNKRELQCKQFSKDVAQLLQNGQEESARLRVEHVIREENILAAYILIEGFCEVISERMLAIENQKACPLDLKEAIASLVFAAPRCADLPELQDIRSLFSSKYGKEFTTSAIELRPDCGVNRQIIEKLSTRVPNIEVKLRLMKKIVTEHHIEWNFEELKTEQPNLAEDMPNSPKRYSGANQTTFKPEDGTSQGSIPGNESDKRFAMPSQSQTPATITQRTSGTYEPSPPTPPPDVSNMSEQQFQPVTKQGHEKSSDAIIYDSPPLHDTLHVKGLNPHPARDFDPDICEDDLHARQQMEGKMNYHDMVTKTTTGVFMGMKQENVKYTDVASAAQAAFESAAYAAAAARAAVDLAKIESGNTNLNKITDNSREHLSEGEDELPESLLRDQNEGKYGVPVNGLGNGNKDSGSRMNDQAFDIESSRMRNGRNVVSGTRSGFEKIHPSQKESSDSEGGEECLGDQVSWSEDGRSGVNKSNQQYHDEYSHSQEEYESNAPFEDKVEPQLKRSISGRVSNSSERSSSHKASRPMFDDSDDDEDEHQMNFSGSPSLQSTLGGYRNFGDEDSPIQHFQHFGNQKQIDDESDVYENVVSRKEYHNQDFTDEIRRVPDSFGSKIMAVQPSKSYEGEGHLFLRNTQRSRPCTPHETQFDDEVKPLNDDGMIKLQYHLRTSILDSQPDSNSPPKRHSKQNIGDMVSDDNSTSLGYKEGMDDNESHHDVRSQYTNSLASDDEGVYRYKGDGKLHWCPANLDKQHASTESHRPSRHGISVRTRR